MNFEIKNIESFFPESILEEAQALLQEDLVQAITPLGKNLWAMKVGESYEEVLQEKMFEVEIQLRGQKVKAFTCDCDFYQQEANGTNSNFCKHIVTGLFGLRKYLLQKEIAKRKKANPSPAKHKRLTTAAVLNSVAPENLKNFVRAYARNDKKFALALKSRFAHIVQVENEKEKYLQLLQATFTSVKTTQDKIKYSSIKQIETVVQDILEHVDDAIALEHYAEATSILQALILRLAPNIKRAENHEERILDLLESTFPYFQTLIKKDLAPELRKEIWQFCFDNFAGGEHKKYGTQRYFFQLLLDLTIEKPAADLLLEKVEEQLHLTHDQKKKGELLLFQMNLLQNFDPDALLGFVEKNLEESEILLAAISNAVQQENFKDARQLALKGMDLQKSVKVKNQLDDFLLNIALKTQQTKDIQLYARKRFLVTYDFNYYQILKSTLAKKWPKELKNLIITIQKQAYSPHKKETIAIIYAEEEMNKELVEYIKKIRSLDLLEKYDTQLIDEFKKEVYELYEDFLESYLRNHLGRKTSQKIKAIFYHLRQIGAKKLVQKLAKQYREQYPERHTLMEELNPF